MDSIIVCMIVFVCTFGAVLLGMWLRTILPEHHLDDETKETVKIGIGLIATMTALVLGLITASAKSSYDDVSSAVKKSAADVLTLDRILARYGPETAEIRANLKRGVGARVEMIWPQSPSKACQVGPDALGSRVAS